MSEQKVPLQDQMGHEWAAPAPGESGRRSRCVRCGAYRHLGSGILSCPGSAAADAPKHTPGPWFQFEGKPECVGGPHPENGTAGVAMCGMRLRDLEECEANATLIASAPDLLAERDALRRFKEYVHARLDAAGVPTDPDSPHKVEGCRIGGRLDLVLARWAAHADLLAACEDSLGLVRHMLEFWDWSRFPSLRGAVAKSRDDLEAVLAKAKGGAA